MSKRVMRLGSISIAAVIGLGAVAAITAFAAGARQPGLPPPPAEPRDQGSLVPDAGSDPAPGPAMTVAHIGELIHRVGDEIEGEDGYWRFKVAGFGVTVVTDADNDRMRIVLGIARAETLGEHQMVRIMQANFDSALDARYAIAQEILWSTFIHPLGPLSDEEFLSGLGQVVNLAATFGSTYSSGLLIFQGGDSEGILDRRLIDELMRKGKAT